MWKSNDPCVLYSCSKDGTLVMHEINEMMLPVDDSKTTGLALNSFGTIISAKEDNFPVAPRATSPSSGSRLSGFIHRTYKVRYLFHLLLVAELKLYNRNQLTCDTYIYILKIKMCDLLNPLSKSQIIFFRVAWG